MLYLSQLRGAPVEDLHGVRLGKISDLLAVRDDPAQRCVFRIEGQDEASWYASAEGVVWRDYTLHLPVEASQIVSREQTFDPRWVALVAEVLDKQVIDVAHKKPVRVNDVCLSEDWHVVGVDNSPWGLIRRLAPPWLLGARSKYPPTNFIAWERVELLGSAGPEEPTKQQQSPSSTRLSSLEAEQMRTVSGQLAELHSADIADIVHQLTPSQGANLLEGLENEIAADAFEEVDTDRQVQILELLKDERAAALLAAMAPDEAADLLGRLSTEHAQRLLFLMTPEESEDVQELLEYAEDTAGGLMTTDYLALDASRSVAEALEAVRTSIQDGLRATYVYCVPTEQADEKPLLGVVSLWDLLAASPTQQLRNLMETDIVSVRPDTEPRVVAEVVAKYNLFAVPVLNENGILEGVVTVDDALDVLLPTARKRKSRRLY